MFPVSFVVFSLRIAPPPYLAGWGGKTRRIMCRVIRVGYGRARCVRGMPRRLTVEQSYFIYEAGDLMTAMKSSLVRLTKMLAQIFYLGMVRRLYDERGIHQRFSSFAWFSCTVLVCGVVAPGFNARCTIHSFRRASIARLRLSGRISVACVDVHAYSFSTEGCSFNSRSTFPEGRGNLVTRSAVQR